MDRASSDDSLISVGLYKATRQTDSNHGNVTP